MYQGCHILRVLNTQIQLTANRSHAHSCGNHKPAKARRAKGRALDQACQADVPDANGPPPAMRAVTRMANPTEKMTPRPFCHHPALGGATKNTRATLAEQRTIPNSCAIEAVFTTAQKGAIVEKASSQVKRL